MKNRYEIRGDTTAVFLVKPRSQKTLETLIATTDLAKVQALDAVYPKWDSTTGSYYAQGYSKETGTVSLHRYLMDAPPDKLVDHVYRNTLDNRRSFLRLLTPAESAQNQGLRQDNSSGYRGVSWLKTCSRWRARVQVNGVQKCLGYFTTPEEANRAAASARKIMLPYAEVLAV